MATNLALRATARAIAALQDALTDALGIFTLRTPNPTIGTADTGYSLYHCCPKQLSAEGCFGQATHSQNQIYRWRLS
jgi:hypothetical protein